MAESNHVNPTPAPAHLPDGGAPKRTSRIVARVALGLVGLLLLAIILAVASVVWAGRTEGGSAWLLSKVPGLQVDTPRGRLLGDFSAKKLTLDLAGDGNSVEVTELAWQGLSASLGDFSTWLHVSLDRLSAQRVDVAITASQDTQPSAPLQPPSSLQLPVEFDLRSLQVAEIYATPLGEVPLRNLDLALHLGAEAGAQHQLEHLTLAWSEMQISASGKVASQAPMALDASVSIKQQAKAALPAWTAQAKLSGPLTQPALKREPAGFTCSAQSRFNGSTCKPL